MKKFLLFGILLLPASGKLLAQSTFGPYWTDKAYSQIVPSTYYSPVTGDTTTPKWSNIVYDYVEGCGYCSPRTVPACAAGGPGYRSNSASPYQATTDKNGVTTYGFPGDQSTPGAGGMVSWNSSAFKAYTYRDGYRTNEDIGGNLNFRVMFPPGYDSPANAGRKYPVILFLHGCGEAGGSPCGNPRSDCDVRKYNNDHQMIHGGQDHRDMNNGVDDRYKAIIIYPQANFNAWADGKPFANGNYDYSQTSPVVGDQQLMLKMMDFLLLNGGTTGATDGKLFRIDLNRVYISGLSNGGGGSWDAIMRRPEMFAAAMPLSSAGPANSYIDRIKYVGVWYWQGGTDNNPIPSVGRAAMDAQQAVTGFSRFTPIDITTGVNGQGKATNTFVGNKRYIEESVYGHGVFTDCYRHPDYWRWLFSQSQLNILPDGDTAVCSGANLNIGIQPNFAEYEWQFSANGTGGWTSTVPNVANINTNAISVSSIGFYRVRFRRTVQGWTDYSQPIQIIPKNASVAPVLVLGNSPILPSKAGSSITISVPTTYKDFTWSNGSTTRSITVSTPGNYSVSATLIGGCPSNNTAPVVILTGQTPNATIGTPSKFASVSASPTSTYLTWQDNSAGETGFEIYRATSSGGTYTYLGITAPNATSFTDTGLDPSTTYFYQVRAAKYGVGASDYAAESSTSTVADNVPPTPPVLSVAGITDTKVSLEWVPSTDNVGIDGYELYQNGVYVTNIIPGNTTIEVNGLAIGTEYKFILRARDAAGNYSPYSNEVTPMTLTLTDGGLAYTYYEGDVATGNIPAFQGIPVIATGFSNPARTDGFDITPRRVNEFFAFSFKGFIDIQTAGTYTFYTSSDDGSLLYINGTKVVDNDRDQGTTERSGTITLNVGSYPIEADYRQRGGGYAFAVKWQGPGIAKSTIPTARLSGFAPAPVYYTKTSGNLSNLTTWGNSTDGTGTNPADFVSNNQLFVIANRTATLDNNMTVSGSSSRIIVRTGGSLLIPADKMYNGRIDVEGSGSVMVMNNTVPNFGAVSPTSTITFGGTASQPINPDTYGNVVLAGSSVKFANGNSVVQGNLTYSNGASVSMDAGASVSLMGNVVLNGNGTLPVPLTFMGSNLQTITGNGNTLILNGGMTVKGGSQVSLSSTGGSTNVSLAGATVIEPTGTLYLGNNTLTVSGNGAINTAGQTGTIGSNGGNLVLSSSSANASNLYFTPASNSVKNITLNQTGGGKVNLMNTLRLTGVLTPTSGEINTTAGSLILVSNATGTASIGKVSPGAVVNGNVTVQRFYTPTANSRGWVFTGTSVKNQKLSDWQDNVYLQGDFSVPVKATYAQYFREDQTTPAPTQARSYEKQGWYAVPSLDYTVPQGNGIKLFFTEDFFNARGATLDNTGLPVIGDGVDNQGDNNNFNFSLTYTPSSPTALDGGGWNLLANPYPSDIDWDSPAWTSTNVTGAVYFFNAKTNSYATYTRGSGGIGTNGGSNRVRLGQGFFVRANGASPVLRVNENAKIASDGSAVIRTEPVQNLLKISLSNKNNDVDETIIRLTDEATPGFDLTLDAYKFYGSSLNISSLASDGKDLVINCLGKADTVRLNLKNNRTGEYSLNFSQIETFASGSRIYLIDRFLKQNTELSNSSVYPFSITADTLSAGAGRFLIALSVPATKVKESIAVKEPVQTWYFALQSAYPNPFDNLTHIDFTLPETAPVTLTVYDLKGKVIDVMKQNGETGLNSMEWDMNRRLGRLLENGMYLYSLQSGGQILRGKMLVNR
jgi:fibronectin type 3 domain-containing protein